MITPKFTEADVKARFDRFLAVIEKKQIQQLQYLGELCVTKAKEIPPSIGFTDQTGNLRSSMGYMVFKDGVAIHGLYEQVAPKDAKEGDQFNGAKKGEALAKKVGAKYKNGISLVVTAGMNYAVYVESRGRDVLTSAEILAKKELPRMVADLKNAISKAMK